jgi:MFS family permease
MGHPVPQRVVAGIAGAGALVLATFGSALVLLAADYAAERPDPSVPDEDPCCGHPDTWGDVAGSAAGAIGGAVAIGLLLSAACGLLWIAVRGRTPRRRWLAAGPLVATLATAVPLAVAIVPHLDEGHARIDCDRFAFDRAAWASGGVKRADVARGLDRCGTLTGARPSTVRGMLGAPDGAAPTLTGRYWRYRDLTVSFARGHVESAVATDLGPG